jgi:hypothetical protein
MFLGAAPSGPEREGGKGLAGMVPHPEALILEAADVESAPLPAVQRRPEERSGTLDDLSSQEVLREAQELLMQVLSLLNDPICENHASATWSFRLARAHALTLLDHLARMTSSP